MSKRKRLERRAVNHSALDSESASVAAIVATIGSRTSLVSSEIVQSGHHLGWTKEIRQTEDGKRFEVLVSPGH